MSVVEPVEPGDLVFAVSICICTRNRPAMLEGALRSVAASTLPPAEVVVSDDSTNDDTRRMIADRYPNVRYVDGPRKGLGPNRNRALREARGSHVLFMDDDAALDPAFLALCRAALERTPAGSRGRTIVSGVLVEHGRVIRPREQTFLGHQSRAYKKGESLRTAVIVAAVFPRNAFATVTFDERLEYGYDEVDVTTRLTTCGWKIALVPNARVYHFPPQEKREHLHGIAESARLYVTFKRYLHTERRPLKAIVFAAVAPLHLLIHCVRRDGLRGATAAFTMVGRAARAAIAGG